MKQRVMIWGVRGLRGYKPDVIMVTNPEYLPETHDVVDKLKVKAKLLAVGTPIKELEERYEVNHWRKSG